MENSIGYWLTLTVALISLLGNFLQYVFPKARTTSEKSLDLAQTMNNVTDSYNVLLQNLREHISSLEEQVVKSNSVISELNETIDELYSVRNILEERVSTQQKQLDTQRLQIDRLQRKLKEMGKEITNPRIQTIKPGD
jgi:uncharacterized coiled-coil DUF342 family protein